jgi:hypothetical protein
MALAALNWRYIGVRSFTAGSINGALDAVYDLGTAVTYADGSTRTPGSGSAWTWAREVSTVTVACNGTPPINALTMKYIIGGTVGASAYTFLTPDTATVANVIVYGMNRASGAYTTWTSATPFTNAGFSGFWRGTRPFATVPYDGVAMWESQEGCVIQFSHAASSTTSSIGLGALVDPLSTGTGNAETDGRLYMMWGSGFNTMANAAWLSNGGGTDGHMWGNGSTSSGNCHAGVFAPGTNVMFGGAGGQTTRFGNFSPTNTLVSTNGDIARVPFTVVSNTGAFLGQLRQVSIIRDAATRLTYQNGATVLGYTHGTTLGTQTDAVVLSY